MDRDKSNNIDVQQLQFIVLNVKRHLSESLAFRKDAWLISFASLQGYSESETTAWLTSAINNKVYLYHLWYEGEIIGQLEFKDDIITDDGCRVGYLYFIYVRQGWRNKGIGQKMHDFVINRLKQSNCQGVMLKYMPSNTIAELFYLKNGWNKVRLTGEKQLQLMRKDFKQGVEFSLHSY